MLTTNNTTIECVGFSEFFERPNFIYLVGAFSGVIVPIPKP